jgi:hypothetical protein
VAATTPVAAYNAETPWSALTDWPLIALITYQRDPDVEVGQVALQDEPLTVPDTVRVVGGLSFALIVELVLVPVRKLTPEHPGT